MRWKFIKIFTILGILLAAAAGGAAMAQEEIPVVYVAGTPDDYPFEYFDRDEGEYKGILPETLKAAAGKIGVQVVYLHPSLTDRREEFSKNLQVELLSDYERRNEFQGVTAGKSFFRVGEGETQRRFCFGYTAAADQKLIDQFEQTLADLSPEEMQTILLTAQMQRKGRGVSRSGRIVLAFLGVMLLCIIIGLTWRLAHWKYQAKKEVERDELTKGKSFRRWKEDYVNLVRDENRSHYCVVYMDAGMERIAQIYGYQEVESDLLLIDRVLKTRENKAESFARFYEDCFIMLKQYWSEERLKRELEAIEKGINEVMAQEKKSYRLLIHFGVYLLTPIDAIPDSALHFSRVSADYAIEERSIYTIYNRKVEQKTIEEYALEHEAIHSLIDNDFNMFLHPLVDIKTRQIIGGKSLVRWQHPVRGLLKPGEFLDVLEKNHLIEQLDFLMFSQACQYLSEDNNGKSLQIMCSFSDTNFAMKDFASKLISVAQTYRVGGEHIIIEISYTNILKERTWMKQSVKQLREFGFSIYMADFNINETFCEFLECGITHLKLNRKLLSYLENESARTLVTGLIDMAHRMGVRVISEGIENEQQENFLRTAGCDYGLGYYYCQPVGLEEFEEVLRREGKRTREPSTLEEEIQQTGGPVLESQMNELNQTPGLAYEIGELNLSLLPANKGADEWEEISLDSELPETDRLEEKAEEHEPLPKSGICQRKGRQEIFPDPIRLPRMIKRKKGRNRALEQSISKKKTD